MKFTKGKSGNPGGRKKAMISPVTLTNLKKHYVEFCELLPEIFVPAERATLLLKLITFEHAELFGKPKEKVEVTGKDGGPIQAVINFGTKPKE